MREPGGGGTGEREWGGGERGREMLWRKSEESELVGALSLVNHRGLYQG